MAVSSKPVPAIDVVVCARDAAQSLGEVLAEIPNRLVRTVIVVDNASRDQTAQVAIDAGAVVLREARVGYGAACRRAIDHLAASPTPPDTVVFLAADGSDDPADIAKLVAPITAEKAELVVGTQRDASGRAGRARRALAVHLIGAIYRHRFQDVSSFCAIRLPALVALGMRDPADGWAVEMQVKALKLGLRIAEVTVVYRVPRITPPSKVAAARRSIGATGRVLFQIFRHATAR